MALKYLGINWNAVDISGIKLEISHHNHSGNSWLVYWNGLELHQYPWNELEYSKCTGMNWSFWNSLECIIIPETSCSWNVFGISLKFQEYSQFFGMCFEGRILKTLFFVPGMLE